MGYQQVNRYKSILKTDWRDFNAALVMILITYLKRSAVQGWERAIYTLSVQRTQSFAYAINW